MSVETVSGRSWLGRLGAWLLQIGDMTLARGGSSDPKDWTVVFSGTQMEAEVVRGHLEVESMPCLLQRESAAAVIGLVIGPLATVNVLVPAALAERALAILDEGEAVDLDPADTEDAGSPETS